MSCIAHRKPSRPRPNLDPAVRHVVDPAGRGSLTMTPTNVEFLKQHQAPLRSFVKTPVCMPNMVSLTPTGGLVDGAEREGHDEGREGLVRANLRRNRDDVEEREPAAGEKNG